MATGTVVEVAFELDGREQVRLSGSRTWKQDVDFGPEYSPHELVARAYDAKGKEIALARQWINLPRPPAEVEITLENDKTGRAAAADLTWASRMGPHPTSVSLTFDGTELPLDVAHHARLPAYDPALTHVVSAQVDFVGGVHSHADRVLGGGKADEAGSELTAIPVRCLTESPPQKESLRERFRANGETLRVTAVAREPARIMLIRDPYEHREAFSSYGDYFGGLAKDTMVDEGDRLQVVWPLATELPDKDSSNVIFDMSPALEGIRANFFFALVRSRVLGAKDGPRRFADAVAVAGVTAAASGSRRALVLVLGSEEWDASRRDASSVRRYLERIHVPLYVWSLTAAVHPPWVLPAAAWGRFEDVSSPGKLRSASRRVLDDVRRQSVVWVEGRHLPQEIALVETGDGLEIAR